MHPGPPRRRIPGCGPPAEPPPPGASEAVVDGAQPHLDARIDCVAAVPTHAGLEHEDDHHHRAAGHRHADPAVA